MYWMETEEGPIKPSILINIKNDDIIIGRIQLVPHSKEMYEAHIFPVKISERGNFLRFAKEALQFIFEDMVSIRKLIAIIPVFNIHAIKMAENLGMRYEGSITNAYLHDGEMIDVDIYGISRGEI
jgi:RimJ/RimL family protein N-acetyltransferase